MRVRWMQAALFKPCARGEVGTADGENRNFNAGVTVGLNTISPVFS